MKKTHEARSKQDEKRCLFLLLPSASHQILSGHYGHLAYTPWPSVHLPRTAHTLGQNRSLKFIKGKLKVGLAEFSEESALKMRRSFTKYGMTKLVLKLAQKRPAKFSGNKHSKWCKNTGAGHVNMAQADHQVGNLSLAEEPSSDTTKCFRKNEIIHGLSANNGVVPR